jgi:arsenate reductase
MNISIIWFLALYSVLHLFFTFDKALNSNSIKLLPMHIHSENIKVKLYPAIEDYIATLKQNVASISDDRKQDLNELAAYIQERAQEGKQIKLTYICTHNSRRSHFGQIWGAVMAQYFGIQNVETFSGGTEATAFNPRAVAAIERVGFKVQNPGGDNPRYQITFADNAPPILCFSKKYNDAHNPAKEFAAIMTCSQADEACPLVAGANFRIALPYEDPKKGDGTPEEARLYDERCRQIAAEMYYAFSLVK